MQTSISIPWNQTFPPLKIYFSMITANIFSRITARNSLQFDRSQAYKPPYGQFSHSVVNGFLLNWLEQSIAMKEVILVKDTQYLLYSCVLRYDECSDGR
jgi:hypothetical protein